MRGEKKCSDCQHIADRIGSNLTGPKNLGNIFLRTPCHFLVLKIFQKEKNVGEGEKKNAAQRSREWCARARCARRGQCQGDHGLPGMYPGSAWSAWIHAAACGAPCRPAAQALGHIQRCLQLLMGAGRCRRGCGRVERTQTSPRLVGCVFCVSVVWCHCSRTLSKRERERALC